jgi:hypothetical protein
MTTAQGLKIIKTIVTDTTCVKQSKKVRRKKNARCILSLYPMKAKSKKTNHNLKLCSRKEKKLTVPEIISENNHNQITDRTLSKRPTKVKKNKKNQNINLKQRSRKEIIQNQSEIISEKLIYNIYLTDRKHHRNARWRSKTTKNNQITSSNAREMKTTKTKT